MSYGVDYPNISGGNLFTSIDPYVATGSQTNQNQWPNGALNPPGAVYAMNTWGQLFSQYAGYNSTFAPFVTVQGTTSTSTSVASVSNTAQLSVGMTVTGSGVPTGTTIATITSATAMTLSKATTSSVTLAQLSCFFGTKVFNGAPPVVKYVRYESQNNPALLAYPAAVYYTDSTCTTVTGYSNEAFGVTANAGAIPGNSAAGWLLYNSTASGLSGAASATALNGNWCWIQVGGLLPGAASVASTLIGDTVSISITAAQSFTVVRTATGTVNPYNNFLGVAYSGISTNTTQDILVNPALAQI